MAQIKLGYFVLDMYPFFALIGWLVAYLYIIYHIKEKYLKRKVHVILEIAVVIAIIGARILWVLILMYKEKRFPDMVDFINGGLIFYGGMLFVIVFIYSTFPYNGMSEYIDIFISAIPLFHGFARIGCFFAGCCYGKDKFPVQLLESFFCFCIFMILNYLKENPKYKGKITYLYLILYGLVRYFLEFLRGDSVRGIWLGLSTSQHISCIIVIVVLVKVKIFDERKKKWKI